MDQSFILVHPENIEGYPGEQRQAGGELRPAQQTQPGELVLLSLGSELVDYGGLVHVQIHVPGIALEMSARPDSESKGLGVGERFVSGGKRGIKMAAPGNQVQVVQTGFIGPETEC